MTLWFSVPVTRLRQGFGVASNGVSLHTESF
jgi:hypothetical protein